MNRARALVLVAGGALALVLALVRERPPAPQAPTTNAASAATEHDTSRARLSIDVTEHAEVQRREVVLMGSLFELAVEAPPEQGAAALERAIERLRKLEDQVSSWRPNSEVSALNANAGIKPVAVSPDTFALLDAARALAQETEGAFDVTIGPVWDLWPFRNPATPIPTRAQLDAALQRVGSAKLVLDRAAGTAYLQERGMAVNLGAIGKGYAAKLAYATLAELGLRRAAVSAGGDLYVGEAKSSGPWLIELENPRWPGRPFERFFATRLAVATSGNDKRKLERNGGRYGHIIDPRNGMPVDHASSASVITDDPVRADAYATALMVLGPDEGIAWIERRHDAEAMIIDREGIRHVSSGFRRRMTSPALSGYAPPPLSQALLSTTLVRAGRLTPKAPSQPLQDFAPPDYRVRTTPEPVAAARTGRSKPPRNMVRVPAGVYIAPDGSAQHSGRFAIDRTEVSNARYREFLEATRAEPHRDCHPHEPAGKDHTPRYWNDAYQPTLLRRSVEASLAPFRDASFREPSHPVVGVDYWDAYAYARWSGSRLPTRAEWSRAACGDKSRRWPWGERFRTGVANLGGELHGEHDGFLYSAPVTSFAGGASPFGCLNMAGNVEEWTDEGMVMGGGSSSVASQAQCHAGQLREPAFRSFTLGFRVAWSAP